MCFFLKFFLQKSDHLIIYNKIEKYMLRVYYMPVEYEYSFYNYNKKNIIKKIKKLGFKKKGQFIFKVHVFTHPLNTPNTYVRIRDEGFRITLTYKYKDSKSTFENEDEIEIGDYEEGIKILLNLGCKTKYFYEKIREIWSLDSDEIIFDINPGEPERMEIESKTKKDLDEITSYLKLHKLIVTNEYDPLKEKFGIDLVGQNLTFLNCKKILSKLITKKETKKEFNELIEEQLTLYNTLL